MFHEGSPDIVYGFIQALRVVPDLKVWNHTPDEGITGGGQGNGEFSQNGKRWSTLRISNSALAAGRTIQ